LFAFFLKYVWKMAGAVAGARAGAEIFDKAGAAQKSTGSATPPVKQSIGGWTSFTFQYKNFGSLV
jgi:hypothetical protein